jgi:hypothetical protein
MNLAPGSLDPFLCTHIVYFQAKLDVDSRKIVPAQPHLDLKEGAFFFFFSKERLR